MAIDLGKLKTGKAKSLIEPRDIFASLPKRPWPRLRVEQDQVLQTWFERRNERDLVVKQNTGSGKTVVGLLIAQSTLNEGKGPAAFAVPDTYLINQVILEADKLGLPTTRDPRGHEFLSGVAILVCTFEKIVNGQTVFGLSGDPSATVLGVVVVDDAHAAMAAARKQFTLTSPRGDAAYEKAIELFAPDLKRQSYQIARDLINGRPSNPLRIPFWAWIEKIDLLYPVLEESAANDSHPGIYFSWPLVSAELVRAVATISFGELAIRTPCPAIDRIPAISQAARRIYLSATLADDGLLVTELDADSESILKPITPDRATDLGDRLILAPGALNPSVIDDTIREMVAGYARGDRDGDGNNEADPINVVVLVPSDARANEWASRADHILHVKTMKAVIDRMTNGEVVGLVVLVNKYDGVDLPHGACRLLVIDGVPVPLDLGEQREAGALLGSEVLRARKVQRLEQGMGRGIRDSEDYCAVLLLGSALALSLVDPADLSRFSPATRTQIELSDRLAEQIRGGGLGQIREALDVFLDRNDEWVEAMRDAIAGSEYEANGHVSKVSVGRRGAWNSAVAGDPLKAVSLLRKSLEDTDEKEQGWRLEELAAYQQEFSPEEAQRTLKAARALNSSVLMPAVVVPPKPLVGTAAQGAASASYLDDRYANATSLRLGVNAMLDDLAFLPDQDRVEAAEAAFRDLGAHLGFKASRPEKEGAKKGPDGCWGLSPTKNSVIELKTGTTRADKRITKTEIDQLSGAVSWNSANGGPVDCLPIMLAQSSQLHELASAPKGARIITPVTLEALKKDVQAFALEIAHKDQWRDPEAVAAALQRHRLTADTVFKGHSVKPAP